MTPNAERVLVVDRAFVRPRPQLVPRRVPRSWHVLKRAGDIVLAGTALIVLSPVIALAALGVACVSSGSPLFLQERVGRNGERFRRQRSS